MFPIELLVTLKVTDPVEPLAVIAVPPTREVTPVLVIVRVSVALTTALIAVPSTTVRVFPPTIG